MITPGTSAIIYACLTGTVFIFQLALVFGAPWGHLTMGGKYQGSLPGKLRFVVLIQGFLLTLLGMAVLTKAGFGFTQIQSIAGTGTWVAVVLSFLSLVLNIITPSKYERMAWAPVAALMLATSLHVALA